MKTSEEIAFEEFEKVGDEKLFPNHTDKDIWISGFKSGFEYNQNQNETKTPTRQELT